MAWTVFLHVRDGDTYRLEVANGLDDQGRPLELRAFEFDANDPQWAPLDNEAPEHTEARVAAMQRGAALDTIDSEITPAPIAPDNLPGVGGLLQ